MTRGAINMKTCVDSELKLCIGILFRGLHDDLLCLEKYENENLVSASILSNEWAKHSHVIICT